MEMSTRGKLYIPFISIVWNRLFEVRVADERVIALIQFLLNSSKLLMHFYSANKFSCSIPIFYLQ